MTRFRIAFALLIALLGVSAALAQPSPDPDAGFTLPDIGESVIESAGLLLRGVWDGLGIVGVDMSGYADLPNARTDDGAFVLGDPDAPVTLVVFADFACPHCQTYESTVAQFIEEYVATGMARFEHRTLPTAGGQLTAFAAQVAECADEQQSGAFWQAYSYFYELAGTGRYNQEIGRMLADELDLSYSDLLTCTQNANQVFTDRDLAIASGVGGTPAVMIRLGDSAPQWIVYDGVTYNRGSVPFDVLAAVVEMSQ